jgi:hypothetical protein
MQRPLNNIWQLVSAAADAQLEKNCWKRCFLCGPSRGYTARTNRTRVSGQPEATWSEEDITGIRYEATASEDTEDSVCCGQQSSTWICYSAIITYSCDLLKFNKFKPTSSHEPLAIYIYIYIHVCFTVAVSLFRCRKATDSYSSSVEPNCGPYYRIISIIKWAEKQRQLCTSMLELKILNKNTIYYCFVVIFLDISPTNLNFQSHKSKVNCPHLPQA